MSHISIPEWFGIFGFCLSLVLAINDLRRRARFLHLSVLKIVPVFADKPEGYIYLDCTVSNPASVPTVITEIVLKVSGVKPLTAISDETMIYQRYNPKRDRLVEFTNSPLPVNLPPRSAQRIVALFHLPASDIPQSLRLPSTGNLPAQVSTWVRVDLSTFLGAIPRYRRAVVADFRVEQEALLSKPLTKS